MKQNLEITKAVFVVPPTANCGSCRLVGTASLSESARENALWQYNKMREHDGQDPVSVLPPGTHMVEITKGRK